MAFAPSIPMSQIIASDAPLLSPISAHAGSWENAPSPTDSFNYNYYSLPPSPHPNGSTRTNSPIPTSCMLRMRMSPDATCENEQLCLPTSQVFDYPSSHSPSPAPSSSMKPSLPTLTISGQALAKRSASPPPAAVKKPRASGERIHSKDFIPPDVSGLSKREARLVKNRAAAFLSRQRKREEFELMEVRVAELEQENARLLALSQTGNQAGPQAPQAHQPAQPVNAEIEQLRAKLAEAEARELELKTELARKAAAAAPPVPAVKVEAPEPQPIPARSTSNQTLHKSGASLGLMVLLCALPTLLSMPNTHSSSTLPTSFSFPITGPSAIPLQTSAFDFNTLIPSEYDWSTNPNSMMDMDLDVDDQGRITTSASASSSASGKLEFVDGEAAGLGALDISFDASSSDSGKIRVRIHNPSSSSSSSLAPSSFNSPSLSKAEPVPLSLWDTDSFTDSFSGSASPYAASSQGSDPFLGVGGAASSEFGLGLTPHFNTDGTFAMFGENDILSSSTMMDFGEMMSSSRSSVSGSSFGEPAAAALGKRRVRIALKSLPAAGGEGGEWEVHSTELVAAFGGWGQL